MNARLQFFRAAPFPRLRVPLPLIGTAVCAGFPSPADDHIEAVIDLNELLIRNPPATFFLRAAGQPRAAMSQAASILLPVRQRTDRPCR